MVATLSLNDLPPDVREAIARGERVCIYDDGKVAATMVPERAGEKGTASCGAIDYQKAMEGVPPLDEDFEKDIDGAFAPVLGDPWAC